MAFNRPGSGFSRTTPAVLNLIIINVLVFIAQAIFGSAQEANWFDDLFALHHYKSGYFHVYQLFTHLFMHANIPHILFNMFALWMFGAIVERLWGAKRFLIFYFACGLGAGITQLLSYAWAFRFVDHAVLNAADLLQYQLLLRNDVTVGASGAIMGVVAAFGYLFPNTEMMIIPIPVPVKAKWAVLGIIAIDVFSGISGSAGDNVAHFAHVGGALTGFLIVYFQNRRNRNTFY